MLRLRLLMLVLGTMLAATAGSAAAATITVNTTFDTSSGSQCSLRQAIMDVDSPGSASGGCAAAAFGDNTIVLGAFTYDLGGPLPALGSLSVAPTVTNLTIEGAAEGQTVIDASALHATALEIAAGTDVTLSGLTISNATASAGATGTAGTGGAGGDGANGGAIVNAGTLTLNDAAVTNSQAGAGGNGGSNTELDGGAGGNGGLGGAIYNTGTLTLNGATIAGNQAGAGGAGGTAANDLGPGRGGTGGEGGGGGAGGGIANVGGQLTVTDSTITANEAGSGGAGGTGGQNEPPGGNGGSGGAASGGGGIVSFAGTVSITNSTLVSNTAGNGGAGGAGSPSAGLGGGGGAGGGGGIGAGVELSVSTTATLVNDTIAGNSTGSGGAAGMGGSGTGGDGAPGAGGAPGTGGGVYDTSSLLTVQNTLLASNAGGNCASPSLTDGGHNLSFGDSSCPSSFATGDPNLGPLADNGGPAQTISLGPDSAALNQIPPSGAGCPASDERGVARPGVSGEGCDIGAYEVAPPTAKTTAATALSNTDATLNATVTPNAGAATTTVQFEWGTTTKYGKTKDASGIGGVVAVPAAVSIGKLKPDTTYHYRVLVTTMDGSATGEDRTFTTKAAPALSRLRLTPARFSATGKSAKVSYNDTEAATTTFEVLRRAGHKRFKKLGSFMHKDAKGANALRFDGRVGGRALKPGAYVLQATPRFDRQSGTPVMVKFSIK